MADITSAILSLQPNAKFAVENDVVIWLDEEITEPTSTEISDEINRLQAIEDAKQYQRDRKAEYPSIEDCVHALLDGGDTLTDLQALRQAVKDKYPKE